MDAANIRIDASLLPSHQGKLVRIIGKLESYNPSSQSGSLSSNGSIKLNLTQSDTALQVNKIYEIIGKVSTSDASVNVYSSVEFSDNTNLDVAAKLVQYTHKVPELFF